MTLDELMKIFHEAQHVFTYTAPGIGGDRIDRAGVTAIVRALRDETRHMTLNRDGLEELFTQILGIAAEEKVAEGIAERADEQRADAPATDPIRDPAPAVCVWTNGFETYENRKWWRAACGWSFYGKPPFVTCGRCGKPIAFTEAK